jgi:hypothetical protein
MAHVQKEKPMKQSIVLYDVHKHALMGDGGSWLVLVIEPDGSIKTPSQSGIEHLFIRTQIRHGGKLIATYGCGCIRATSIYTARKLIKDALKETGISFKGEV